MNLQLEWVEVPRDEWIDDIESMADGYPFEKRKEDVLNEDRPARCRSTWEREDDTSEFLAGFFEKKLVGWIRTRRDDFLTDRLGTEYVVTDWELIQRNRDDVRGELLDAIRERYPDSIIQFSQPSQNRTARNFYLKQADVVEGPTDLYLGRTFTDEPSAESGDNSKLISLNDEDAIESVLPSETTYFACRNLLEPVRGQDLLTDRISNWLRRDSVDVFTTDAEAPSAGLAVVDREPPDLPGVTATGQMPYLDLPASDKTSDGFLESIRQFLSTTDLENIEVRLDEPSELEHNRLRADGFQSLSKRMYFFRLPGDVETPFE